MTRVMVVDDSATVRQVVSGIIDAAPGLEVMAAVRDPLVAMERMKKEWPDVIILDVEMPRMDGLTFLRKVMGHRPTPVVMCSTLTEEGSATTLEALRCGAVEAVAKPKGNMRNGLRDSGRLLVEAVRAASEANLRVVKSLEPSKSPPPKLTADAVIAPPATKPGRGGAKLIAIGTSTGGTQALEAVLSRLPADVPPIVVVQHMPEKFTHAFAGRLDSVCAMKVREAHDGDELVGNTVFIAPGGRHLLVHGGAGRRARLEVKDGPLVSRHRPSVDVLFRSVAKASGANALGIIMTGMGDDGAVGLSEMRQAGAATIGQDEDSCVVYGMPAAAMRRGGVQREVGLDEIPKVILGFGR